MSAQIKRAMLLAAGLGTRLRPLTLTTPKPLLTLDGALLIDHQLRYLAGAKISKVVINLHHLGDKIKDHVGDGSRYGLSVTYSEEPKILGTGGGIKKAGAFFGNEPFLALNSDALIDVDVGAVISAHFKTKAAATMVVKELSPNESYNPVLVGVDFQILGFGSGKHFYTGLQILSSSVIETLPPQGEVSCLINDGYKKLIEAGEHISSFIHRGYFNDLGTPERYEAAKRDVASGAFKILK